MYYRQRGFQKGCSLGLLLWANFGLVFIRLLAHRFFKSDRLHPSLAYQTVFTQFVVDFHPEVMKKVAIIDRPLQGIIVIKTISNMTLLYFEGSTTLKNSIFAIRN